MAFEGEAKSSGEPKLILSAAVPASFEAIAAGYDLLFFNYHLFFILFSLFFLLFKLSNWMIFEILLADMTFRKYPSIWTSLTSWRTTFMVNGKGKLDTIVHCFHSKVPQAIRKN